MLDTLPDGPRADSSTSRRRHAGVRAPGRAPHARTPSASALPTASGDVTDPQRPIRPPALGPRLLSYYPGRSGDWVVTSGGGGGGGFSDSNAFRLCGGRCCLGLSVESWICAPAGLPDRTASTFPNNHQDFALRTGPAAQIPAQPSAAKSAAMMTVRCVQARKYLMKDRFPARHTARRVTRGEGVGGTYCECWRAKVKLVGGGAGETCVGRRADG